MHRRFREGIKMNKFAKGCLVTAIAFLSVGIILSMIGRIGGGREDLREMEENGLNFMWWPGLSFHWGDNEIDFDFLEKIPNITHDTHHDKSDLNAADSLQSGESIDVSSITKLDIELGGGYLFLDQDSSAENGSIRIAVDAGEEAEVNYYVKKDTLHIEGFKNKKWDVLPASNDNYIYVTLPKDFAFQKSEIELGAGYIEINNGAYGQTEIDVGAGEIVCNGIKTGKMEADVGAGNVVAADIEADALDFCVAMGSVTVDGGTIGGNIVLSCEMGSLYLGLRGAEEEYNYDIECEMGSILIGDSEYSGLGKEKYISNHAAKELKAECEMGSIEVNFID